MQVPTNNLQGTSAPPSDGEEFLQGLSHAHLLMALGKNAKADQGSWSDLLSQSASAAVDRAESAESKGGPKGVGERLPGMTDAAVEANKEAQGIGSIGRGQVDPKAFEEDVLMMPESKNIEERRGTDQIKQLYKLGAGEAAMRSDMREAEGISNALRRRKK